MPELKTIPLCDIDPPPAPMRSSMDDVKLDELACDLRRRGQQQNVGLQQVGGRYQIVWGHRRYVAAQMAGLHELAAKVYDESERVGPGDMFAENLHREDVNDADIAEWIAERVDKDGWDEARLVAETGKRADWIGDRYRLLQGDAEVFFALQRGEIKFAVARELNKEKSEKWRRFYLREAIQLQASSKQVAVWRQHTPMGDESQPETLAGVEHAAEVQSQAATSIPCVWCSEDYAQFNMDVVQVHKWCRVQMQQVLKQAEATA
jgi:ParB/RepB/Spo0J family partition protein